jgi:formate/nitrite transporter FocA (FNT family)
LIYASLGTVIGGAVAVALIDRQWYGKPVYILPDFGH